MIGCKQAKPFTELAPVFLFSPVIQMLPSRTLVVLWFEVFTPLVIKHTEFWDKTLCSYLKVPSRVICLPPAFTILSFSAYLLTVRMEARSSSETSDYTPYILDYNDLEDVSFSIRLVSSPRLTY
jgi:hypothetical protein